MNVASLASAPRIFAPAWTHGEMGGDDRDAAGQPAPIDTYTPTVAPSRGGRPQAVPNTEGNPQVGTAKEAPTLSNGALKSPVFLGTEEQYFKEARRCIENAKPGDMLAVQMYEFENAATNGDKDAAKQSPGYADQQSLLPGLIDAANRGVKVHVILDGSKNPKTGRLMNQPIIDELVDKGKKSGNMTLDIYPANTVNIDHAKELIHFSPDRKGGFAVNQALVGGSNWGNHTPANDDGGAVFYGPDAMGAARIFFRDQAYCRGDVDTAPLPTQDMKLAVQWAVTSPRQEGGGSDSIKQAKLGLINEADGIYLNQFCLNNPELKSALISKGSAVHARLDPNEFNVNKDAVNDIRKAGGEALWANTELDAATMPGQKNHEKVDVYTKHGVPFALTMGSANDTGPGLEIHINGENSNGHPTSRNANHEIDAVVRLYTSPDGSYSTQQFLADAFAKNSNDLKNRSLVNPPHTHSGTTPGNF